MKVQKTIYLAVILSTGLLSIQSCSKDDDGGKDDKCNEHTWFQDADGDGFGNPHISLFSCSQPTGYVSNSNDFDDNNPSAYPYAPELCNGIDDNGNGIIDENSTDCGNGEVCESGSCVSASTYYKDSDGDGFGDNNNSIVAGSSAPEGYVIDNTDCDDSNAAIHPGAPENTSNGIDDNSNGEIDECFTSSACDDGDPLTYDVCINGFCQHYATCNSDVDCPQGTTCVDVGIGYMICQ